MRPPEPRGRIPMHDETLGHDCPIEEATMQRWEYLEVQVFRENWVDSLGRRGELPRESVIEGGSGYPSLYSSAALLNELGEQGWELAGVAGGADVDSHKLLLKRPRV